MRGGEIFNFSPLPQFAYNGAMLWLSMRKKRFFAVFKGIKLQF